MASGVNPLDTKIRRGEAAHAKMRPPAVLGIDMAGVVEAVGAGVDSFRVGDEVFGMTGGVGGVQGSLAELAAVDARSIAHKPRSLSMEQTAAHPLGFIPSWQGLVDRAGVSTGQQVLIHGGATLDASFTSVKRYTGHIVAQATALADDGRLAPRLNSTSFTLDEVTKPMRLSKMARPQGK